MRQQTDKIGRSTALEPIIVNPAGIKRIEQAERIVDIRHSVAEVITVILRLKHIQHFIIRASVGLRQLLYRLSEITFQFLLRYTAKSLILGVHADVFGLVETTEHTHLRKFCHTGQEDKLQVFIRPLEGRIKTFQNVTMLFLQVLVIVQDVKNRLVVFIHQHHSTQTRFLISRFQQFDEPQPSGKTFVCLYSHFTLP